MIKWFEPTLNDSGVISGIDGGEYIIILIH